MLSERNRFVERSMSEETNNGRECSWFDRYIFKMINGRANRRHFKLLVEAEKLRKAIYEINQTVRK